MRAFATAAGRRAASTLLLAASAAFPLGLSGCGIPSTPPVPEPAAEAPAPASEAPASTPAAEEAVATPALESAPLPLQSDIIRVPTPLTPDAAPEEVEQALMDQWVQLPEAGSEALDVNAAVNIAMKLRAHGPNGVSPLLDTLGEDPGNPLGKMLVVIALTHIILPEDADRLIELTAPGVETTGRACAATLLSYLDTPAARARTLELLSDDNRRVRVATIIALLMTEDEAAIEHLDPVLRDSETTAPERQQILLAMPDSIVADHLDLFAAAIDNPEMADAARERAIGVIGQLGDSSHAAPLEAVVNDDDAPPMLRSLATEARDAIRVRGGA